MYSNKRVYVGEDSYSLLLPFPSAKTAPRGPCLAWRPWNTSNNGRFPMTHTDTITAALFIRPTKFLLLLQ